MSGKPGRLYCILGLSVKIYILFFLQKKNSHRIHDFYIVLLYESRIYQQWLERKNRKLQRRGLAPETTTRKLETENFQDPQVSLS